jgi:guanine deaminase
MPSVSDNQEIYVGNIVTGGNRSWPLVKENLALVVKDGLIIAKGNATNILDRYDGEVTALGDYEFLAPGFVDAHVHAPQFKNGGMHLDKPLLDWLQNYTFPLEDRFKDVEYAERTYPHVIKATLSKGSTTTAYFGSIHKDSCLVLAEEAESQGQRAFVGKTNMDENNLADYYRDESSQQSLNDTHDFVNRMSEMNLTEAIITPRFALSCSMGLMKRLGLIAKQHGLAVQSHINENETEVKVAKEMFPDCKDYLGVYEDAGLMGPRSIFAHSIFTTDDEYRRMAATGTSVIHCPDSNIQLMSGLFNGPKVESHGVNIGLGTDVGASAMDGIVQQIRMAELVSKIRAISQSETKIYTTYRDAYHWATLGGAKALGVDHLVGSLEIGKRFDAIVADLSSMPAVYYEVLQKSTTVESIWTFRIKLTVL